MYFIRYVLFFFVHLFLAVARYPLAVFAVLMFSSPDKRFLTVFKWLETIDNDLTGDDGWKNEHLIGTDPLSVINRIRWLFRNGGNRVSYEVIGVLDDEVWRARATNAQGPFWKRPDGVWLYRNYFKITEKKYLELFLGWAIRGPQKGRCKYVFTIRLRSAENVAFETK